jgi:hypothetical protein
VNGRDHTDPTKFTEKDRYIRLKKIYGAVSGIVILGAALKLKRKDKKYSPQRHREHRDYTFLFLCRETAAKEKQSAASQQW